MKDSYIADGAFHTAIVTSYNPNDYGLYCMSGNVAEMVYYEDENNLPGTKGGSWTSVGQELQIKEGKDRFKGMTKPNVNIGFRPVITYLTANKSSSEGSSCYRFPILAWKEIADNNRRKKMLSKLHGKNIPFGFVFIPEGEMLLGKRQVKQKAFYIKQTEVSNIQYKTFLYDLLIQGKKEEFLVAKPDQTQWNKYDKNMKDNYFSNEKYNDYPVVNISREGALMYCKWLSDEINKSQQKKLKSLLVSVRIPMIDEWEYAASSGKGNSYGWDNLENRQNSRGCFLANFKYNQKLDTILFTGCEIKDINAKTTSGLLLGKNSYTVKINSYNPNDYGLYCISGNVSEMVSYPNGSIGSKGGSWNSTGENIKILAPDEFKGVSTPNVNIGFRPIFTFIRETK